jgi:hypothetical protein
VTEYNLLLLAHLLLFVYWLGADIGVFHASRYVANPALTLEARATALRIMLWIDQIPRWCLVLILPVGYTLAYRLGLVQTSATVIAVIWIASIAWLAMVLAVHHSQGTGRGETLRRIDLAFRLVVIFGLSFEAWSALAGNGYLQAPWLAVKLQIFALLVACGLMTRVVTQPFVVAFGRLMREGSKPELEAQIATGLARARPWVIAIWIGLVVAAYLGLAKPDLSL